MNEILKRTLTALILIIIVFSMLTFLPLTVISGILFLVISVAVYEFIKLSNLKVKSIFIIFLNGLIIAFYFTFEIPSLPQVLIAILLINGIFFLLSVNKPEKLNTFVKDFSTHFFVIFYLYFPLYYLLELKKIGEQEKIGANYLFFLIMVIALGDSGAYFIGKSFGKHKIYPIASPNKSLEGLIAGIITGGLAGWFALLIFDLKEVSIFKVILTGSLMALISQISDPIESLFKRSAKKKDSGSILPGHGGLLDRLDSYIFCAPIFYYFVYYFWL